MKCKKKVYRDGEYTLCSRCEKAENCEDVCRCVICGRMSPVFYDRNTDCLWCNTCLHERMGHKRKKREIPVVKMVHKLIYHVLLELTFIITLLRQRIKRFLKKRQGK